MIHADPEGLARAAAQRIERAAAEAIAARGRFTIALAGGSTPKRTYELLAQSWVGIEWPKVHVVMGDERLVAADDPRSNFAMAREALLAHVPIPPAQVFPVRVELGDEARIVADYTSTLRTVAPATVGDTRIPRLDLVLLGLGSDGHTASLFPGHPSLEEQSAILVSTSPGTLPPPLRRVTFTYPMINAARGVMFLVAGADKADAVGAILAGTPPIQVRPAAGVAPVDGVLEWLLDEAAATALPEGMVDAGRAAAPGATGPTASPGQDGTAGSFDRVGSAARSSVRLLVSDVDGTLVNHAKEITPNSIDAIHRLRAAGVAFAIVSSRAPSGVRALLAHVTAPTSFGAFNGGVVVDGEGREIRRVVIDAETVRRAVGIIDAHGVDAWAFTDEAWFARTTDSPHARRERIASAMEPTSWPAASGVPEGVAKLTAVSDDAAVLATVESELREALGDSASISRSQSYYIDLTSPQANKGEAVRAIAAALGVPLSATAVIGDGLNDLPMFEVAGRSIAMGNASEAVKRVATAVTASNDADGFAQAVARSILCDAPTAPAPS